MLPGGQGIATSPVLSQDSVYLLVLAIKMAYNSLRAECPIGNGSLQQSRLQNRNLESQVILSFRTVFFKQ